MNNSITLRTGLALTILLTSLAVGGSGSAKMSHIRGAEAAGAGDQMVRVVVQSAQHDPVEDAYIELSYEEYGVVVVGGNGSTDSRGGCNVNIAPGKYLLKVTASSFEDYTEHEYVVREGKQIKRIELTPKD